MGMTERDKKVLAIVIAIVVLGGYWFLVLGKKRSAIKTAQEAQITAQAELESAKTAEQAALKVAKVKPAAYSRLLRLGKAIPVDDDFQSLLVQINDITVRSFVTFKSLAASDGSVPNVGATGSTTCQTNTTPPTGAAPSPATGPTGASGSTAETWVGKDRDKAKNAVSQSDQANAQTEAAAKAAECQNSPTLTDIAAKAAGLKADSYTLTFIGSFYDLKTVFNNILDLVEVQNKRVSVTGRLLDINSIAMTVTKFPFLSANVVMTGYELPVVAASNGTELNATPTTPASTPGTTPTAAPAQ